MVELVERMSGCDPRRSSWTGWGRGGAAATPLPLSCGKGDGERVPETALLALSLLVPGEILRGGLCKSGGSELGGVQQNWCRGGAEQSFSKPEKPHLGKLTPWGDTPGGELIPLEFLSKPPRSPPFLSGLFRPLHAAADGAANTEV